MADRTGGQNFLTVRRPVPLSKTRPFQAQLAGSARRVFHVHKVSWSAPLSGCCNFIASRGCSQHGNATLGAPDAVIVLATAGFATAKASLGAPADAA